MAVLQPIKPNFLKFPLWWFTRPILDRIRQFLDWLKINCRYDSSAEIVYLMEEHGVTSRMSENGWFHAYNNAVISECHNLQKCLSILLYHLSQRIPIFPYIKILFSSYWLKGLLCFVFPSNSTKNVFSSLQLLIPMATRRIRNQRSRFANIAGL